MKVWRRVNSWQRLQKTQDKKGVCLFKEVKPRLSPIAEPRSDWSSFRVGVGRPVKRLLYPCRQ